MLTQIMPVYIQTEVESYQRMFELVMALLWEVKMKPFILLKRIVLFLSWIRIILERMEIEKR
jgi:hypothetical protein